MDGSTRRPKTASEISAWCADYLSTTLNVPQSRIDPDAKFARIGLDSAMSIFMVAGLEEWLGIDIPPDVVFEYQTINALAAHLSAQQTSG